MVNPGELENILIGGLLMEPNRLIDVDIKAEDFVLDTARKAFVEIKKLWSAKKEVDIFELSKSGLNPKWLAETTDIGSAARIPYLAKEISLAAQKRRILLGLEKIKKDSSFSDNDTLLADLIGLYNSENKTSDKKSDIKSIMKMFDKIQTENRKNGRVGINTGFDFFTEKYIYYVPGHVWAMGGYTSVGKTASMVEMLSRLDDNAKTCIVSTEMTREQIVSRLLSRDTGFNSQVIISGNIHADRIEDEELAKKKLAIRNLNIYEDVYQLDDIVSVLRRKKMQGGLDIAWVDYIQNCKVNGSKNEYQAMGTIAKTLQKVAKDLRCTIVLLSQVGNAAAREDSGLLEFKGAGDISAVADIGIWLTRNPDNKTQLLWDVRKNRHGRTGAQVLQFIDSWTRLQEIDSIKNK